MAVTLKDIARECGCSVQVASAALNGSRGTVHFSERTRQRVEAVSEQLGYQRRQRKRRTPKLDGVIQLVVGGHVEPQNLSRYRFLMDALEGFELGIQEAGFHGTTQRLYLSMYSGSDGSSDVEKELWRRLDTPGHRLQGVALLHWPSEQVLEPLVDMGIPAVFINPEDSCPTNAIMPDDAQGVTEAVRYLYSLGHRRLAYVQPNHRMNRVCALRLEVLQKIASELGMEVLLNDADGLAQLDEFVVHHPDAYLTYCGGMEEWQYLRDELQVQIPEEASLLSLHHDEFLPSAMNLTHVAVPFMELGISAAQKLVGMIRQRQTTFSSIVLPERLAMGATCAVAGSLITQEG